VPSCCCTCYSNRLTTLPSGGRASQTYTGGTAAIGSGLQADTQTALSSRSTCDRYADVRLRWNPSSPLSAFFRIQLHPSPFLRTSFMDDPQSVAPEARRRKFDLENWPWFRADAILSCKCRSFRSTFAVNSGVGFLGLSSGVIFLLYSYQLSSTAVADLQFQQFNLIRSMHLANSANFY